MKKFFICAAVVVIAALGVKKATDVTNGNISDLQLDNVEALGGFFDPPELTFREYKYGDCVYYKCDQGGNFNKTGVFVTCTREVSAGGFATVTETVEVKLNKCFYGGKECGGDEDCLTYFLFHQPR